MASNTLAKINRISRWTLAFVFAYHGLVPKILWLSPTEVELMQAHHLDASIFSPVAGVFELLLALSIVTLKKSLVPVYLAMLLLLVLLLDVLLIKPELLIDAFNPVTVNGVTFIMAYIVCITHSATKTLNVSKL
ncbi:DoxX-like family protein [Pleionea sediminis]|uniref:DoxX-like family protein n=1 Tax=Pleionea sediminis TaxID=2569479 RepID=UPI001185DE06|nr:DoxX-like family protein [Pleionea sediminis]